MEFFELCKTMSINIFWMITAMIQVMILAAILFGILKGIVDAVSGKGKSDEEK